MAGLRGGTVRFYRQKGTVAATCSADTRSPVVSFSLGNRWMTSRWFSQRGPSQLALIYPRTRPRRGADSDGARSEVGRGSGCRRGEDQRGEEERLGRSHIDIHGARRSVRATRLLALRGGESMSNHDELKGLGASWLLVSGELGHMRGPRSRFHPAPAGAAPGRMGRRGWRTGTRWPNSARMESRRQSGGVVRLLLAKRPTRTERAVALVSSCAGLIFG